MKVDLKLRDDGVWQADIVLPDGGDHHAIGRSLADALIELGMYLKTVRPKSDLQVLAETMVGRDDAELKARARVDLDRLQSRAWPVVEFDNMVNGMLAGYGFERLEDLKLWAKGG